MTRACFPWNPIYQFVEFGIIITILDTTGIEMKMERIKTLMFKKALID